MACLAGGIMAEKKKKKIAHGKSKNRVREWNSTKMVKIHQEEKKKKKESALDGLTCVYNGAVADAFSSNLQEYSLAKRSWKYTWGI